MATAAATRVDEALELERETRRLELRTLFAAQARIAREITEVVRTADDRGDWKAAGYRSSATWLAWVSSIDHRTAAKVSRTSAALRLLPALDEALSTGSLTFDQVAAAARFATPASERELVRIAPGKSPGEIATTAREMEPPVVLDDQALYARRSLSMSWTHGRQELLLSGRLPLELGAAFEQTIVAIAGEQHAADRRDGVAHEWQHATADALMTLVERGIDGAHGRGRATLIVHVGEGGPPVIEGAGPTSPETAERLACTARRLVIRREGEDLVHSRVGRTASYAQLRALHRRDRHCRYPGCTGTRGLEAHHIVPDELSGRTVLDNLILLCHRHHKRLHDHHIRTGGRADEVVFRDARGREITTAQPHAPPG